MRKITADISKMQRMYNLLYYNSAVKKLQKKIYDFKV